MKTKTRKIIIRPCIVKDDAQIKELLLERFDELDISHRTIVTDAMAKGYHISESALCRYFKNGNIKGTLSQENIVWLTYRYGIDVNLNSAKIMPYDEKSFVKRLKTHFK